MKKNFFTLMLSTALFITNPLFAMGPPEDNKRLIISRMPSDMIEKIIGNLSLEDVLSLASTSPSMQKLSQDSHTYWQLQCHNLPFKPCSSESSAKEQVQEFQKFYINFLSDPTETYKLPFAFLLYSIESSEHKNTDYYFFFANKRFKVKTDMFWGTDRKMLNNVNLLDLVTFSPATHEDETGFKTVFSLVSNQNRTQTGLINAPLSSRRKDLNRSLPTWVYLQDNDQPLFPEDRGQYGPQKSELFFFIKPMIAETASVAIALMKDFPKCDIPTLRPSGEGISTLFQGEKSYEIPLWFIQAAKQKRDKTFRSQISYFFHLGREKFKLILWPTNEVHDVDYSKINLEGPLILTDVSGDGLYKSPTFSLIQNEEKTEGILISPPFHENDMPWEKTKKWASKGEKLFPGSKGEKLWGLERVYFMIHKDK